MRICGKMQVAGFDEWQLRRLCGNFCRVFPKGIAAALQGSFASYSAVRGDERAASGAESIVGVMRLEK